MNRPPNVPSADLVLDRQRGVSYEICLPDVDRTGWHPDVSHFYGYWLRIKPPGLLPGRQHFDVLDIPMLMPRVWLLDVLRDPLRYRFRFAGTKKVESLGREVTGRMLEDVHAPSPGRDKTFARLNAIVTDRVATYRKGLVGLEQGKTRHLVENVMLPFARDGSTVDIIAVHSVVFNMHGVVI